LILRSAAPVEKKIPWRLEKEGMVEVPDCAVAIMAKAPRPGEVKTRLCPPLFHEEAAQLYRCFLLDKIKQVSALEEAAAAIAYTPDDAKSLFESMVPPGFTLIPQQGADLGERLAHTFQKLFACGHKGVLAVDSDTPTLPLSYLQTACKLILEPKIDVVLGPSEDGGYYLIGLKAFHPELFFEMKWSNSQVLSETTRRAEAKSLKIAFLPTWYDVDTPEELQRLRLSLDSDHQTPAENTKLFFRDKSSFQERKRS